ncbi:hypothetical protein ZIOFF_018567 [Zingiber officinale]|uniref:Uncharacterized protein n=1 Tax=Zingiber officinale TaxID=94328 RepID=A0A8J5HKZ2_ZINOF|nr:hypothetical protein ZIOFF_018567 [Zingiber officinale]
MTNTGGLRNWLFEKLSSSRPRDQTPFVSRDNIGLLPYACVMWASLVFTSSSSLLNYNPYSHILGILLLIIFMAVESSSSLRLDYNRIFVNKEGFMALQDAGTFGRAILELGSDDEGPSTEAHSLAIIEVLGQRSRNEVLAEIYMVAGTFGKVILEVGSDDEGPSLWLCRLLEPLEKQFLSLGVMTKVQAQRHMDDPAIIEVLGQRSRNEVLAEIYMVAGTFGKAILELGSDDEGIFVNKEGLMALQVAGTFGKAILEVAGTFGKAILELGSDDEGIFVNKEGLMALQVAGTFGKTILEVGSDDEDKRNSYFLCLAALHVWKTIFFSRLLEPLEKQFLRLGVMTKVQAQRHMDDPAIIEVLGQRSCNEILAEIYMVAGTLGKAILEVGSDDEGIFVNKEGFMALQVAGTLGKAILEVGSDDDGPSTEAHGWSCNY